MASVNGTTATDALPGAPTLTVRTVTVAAVAALADTARIAAAIAAPITARVVGPGVAINSSSSGSPHLPIGSSAAIRESGR